jgi:hypothetical protein
MPFCDSAYACVHLGARAGWSGDVGVSGGRGVGDQQ